MAQSAAKRIHEVRAVTRPADFEAKLVTAVAEFGAAIREPLAAMIGQAEDQIGDPVAQLVSAAGRALGLRLVTHAEVALRELSVRPDYAVNSTEGTVGYIEVKRPGKGADPTLWSSRSHDGLQWQKLKLLPNVLYTDGQDWALYRNGARFGAVARLAGDLAHAGRSLRMADRELVRVIEQFLWWMPESPRNLRTLVRTVARLCRYLREEVIEVLEYEQTATAGRPFTVLAEEWRRLLFPRMTNPIAFADAYAQTITFALLLARSVGVTFEGRDLPSIGRQLGKQHALIGRALGILSDPAAANNITVIETLRRVVGAIDWDELDTTSHEAHALLYESFLEEYDPQLRRESGSYYTPDRLARAMVRFTDQVIKHKLDRPWGYASDDVIVVDPAMGTGTFLVEIVDLVASTVAKHQGPGARPQRLRELFQKRLIGFERQVTPYAVAELRLHDALTSRYVVDVPRHEMRFLADTFEDPDKQELAFGSMYSELQSSRDGANRVKRDIPVMVVIGNPPYVDRAHTRDPAPWIEDRRNKNKPFDISLRPSLDEFRQGGRRDYKLAATWVFYWRWAIWKAFEAHPGKPCGVVAFITPSSYLVGLAFAGMRSYLRHVADEAWIIDVSPERHQPPSRTRLFPKVQQPLCIAVFVRYGAPSAEVPAEIHYRAVTGTRAEKLDALLSMDLETPGWKLCPNGWADPFIPIVDGDWLQHPSLADIMPWQAPGSKAKRTWVIAPSVDVLERRWAYLVSSPAEKRDLLMKTTRMHDADTLAIAIPRQPQPSGPLRNEDNNYTNIVPYAYRSFDRQFIILDSRIVDFPSPDLWEVACPNQIFVSEQHSNTIDDGPGLVFTSFVPDMDHFQGHHGGHVLPLYRDFDAQQVNINPRLREHLSRILLRPISGEDILAYVAAVVAHPGYTRRYRRELRIPGIRVPLSKDTQLWERAIQIGRGIVWLQTFGTRFANPSEGRARNTPRLPDSDTPRIITPIPYAEEEMPNNVRYEPQTETVIIGDTGCIGPVSEPVWRYTVAGMPVVNKWISYRLKRPRGRPPATPLDTINATCWTRAMNDELLDLLNVIGRLVEMQPAQEALLDEIRSRPFVTVAELYDVGVLPTGKSERCRQSWPPPPGQLLA
jgi:hypothetical protein